MKTLGLIVNPVAGMGGSVGLKGTDGALYKKALTLGAEPVTPGRTAAFLSRIARHDEITLLVAPGEMGARYVAPFDIPFTVVGKIGDETSAEDTRRIAAQMVERGSTQSPSAELLIFVGGDGTARDVCDAIDCQIPVVAVPAGVKVYSAVFALNPRAAAEMVAAFVSDGGVTEEEVLDIDEEAFREDRLASRHYGYLLVPRARRYLQQGKVASSGGPSVEESKKEIAAYIVENMDPETLYLLGPGTTVRAITDAMGLPKTLLGVDAVHDHHLVGRDLNERGILDLFERYERRVLVVTPLGGNGFILGRGNKQFTPQVVRRVGLEHVRVIATRQKLKSLDCLRVDTGDLELDEMLSGWTKVTVGYRQSRMIKVAM
ncbi:MAG: ATP-NAD kinase family protein [Anaerolineae bacterium]|jgi:predicted polyphosphate/ATP-dependent NAD kinase